MEKEGEKGRQRGKWGREEERTKFERVSVEKNERQEKGRSVLARDRPSNRGVFIFPSADRMHLVQPLHGLPLK